MWTPCSQTSGWMMCSHAVCRFITSNLQHEPKSATLHQARTHTQPKTAHCHNTVLLTQNTSKFCIRPPPVDSHKSQLWRSERQCHGASTEVGPLWFVTWHFIVVCEDVVRALWLICKKNVLRINSVNRCFSDPTHFPRKLEDILN